MEVWKKNLYSIWVSQFVAMVGMSMVVPFLPFYIRELGVINPDELEHWSGLFSATVYFIFSSDTCLGSSRRQVR
ncbi:MAG: hypothetical protein IPG09_01275 [Ignavibacteria bacterium]|nr:hypothetical protein [Ignavibacteria bacterium]